MTDGSGSSSYSYDVFNELTSHQDGASKTIGYSYDLDGNPTGITYPLGSPSWATTSTVTYNYDDADQLDSLSDFNGNTITIDNTADGLPSSVALASSGDTITTTYDATDSPSAIALDNTSTTLLGFDYSDAPSRAIESETDTPSWSGSPAAYTYDPQGRVTQMSPGSGSDLNYSFDASNNITTLPTSATGTYDHASELTSAVLSGTTTNLTYDTDGQRTQTKIGTTIISSASYNGANRLTAFSNAAANMSAASYDGNGLRVSTTITPTGGSATNSSYTWDTELSSVPHILTDGKSAYVYAFGDTPIEQVDLTAGTATYLIADSLGSVRGTVNSTGSLTGSTAYDAWGNSETSGGLTTTTPFGYAGSYTDPTGLTYLINRYYDPGTGQFISVDPLVDDTGQPYAYAEDDPIDSSDPAGLASLCLFGHCVYTHSFDPTASLDAAVNFGRGASFGLSDTVANWISPGASCTVPGNPVDQALGNVATTVVAGEALGALVSSVRGGAAVTSVEDLLSNPQLLSGKTPAEVEGLVGDSPGWRVETLGRGSHEGQGWVLREYDDAGNPTGRVIRWHPGGGQHGPDPYWRVSSPSGGKSGIIN